jgi:sortase (surface protein transpeptidase)
MMVMLYYAAMGTGLEIKQKFHIKPIKWFMILLLFIFLGAGAYYTYRWFMTGEMPPFTAASAASFGAPYVDQTPVTDAQRKSYMVPGTNPRYLSIKNLGINNARIYPVGVTNNNVLDMPKNISDVAWYSKSAAPGSGFGTVVVDAHSDGYAKEGIFAKLSTLSAGDSVSLERGDGKVVVYNVVSNVEMSLEDMNKTGMRDALLSIESDKEGLNLITNSGNYVPRLGQFDKRILVRAVAK